ncbi:hypothetical protein [Paenibacillus sp. PL2-23]
MDKSKRPKPLLFQKAHEEAKKGMKGHKERERIEHEAQLQKARDKRKKQ